MSASIILYGRPLLLVRFEVSNEHKVFNASKGGIAEKLSASERGFEAFFTSLTTMRLR